MRNRRENKRENFIQYDEDEDEDEIDFIEKTRGRGRGRGRGRPRLAIREPVEMRRNLPPKKEYFNEIEEPEKQEPVIEENVDQQVVTNEKETKQNLEENDGVEVIKEIPSTSLQTSFNRAKSKKGDDDEFTPESSVEEDDLIEDERELSLRKTRGRGKVDDISNIRRSRRTKKNVQRYTPIKKNINPRMGGSLDPYKGLNDDQVFEMKQAEKLHYQRSLVNPINSEGSSRNAFKSTTWQKADIDPMSIDQSITFDSIGGLDHHIKALKEMVILPLLYPEVFKKFNLSPPKGGKKKNKQTFDSTN